VLDLFAGTGALGFEALSRGAAFALQVEAEPDAGRLIRRNSAALGCGGTSALLRQDATRLGPAGALAPFDLVFADPPYGRELARPALLACAAGGWLRAGALAVVEEKGDGFAFPEGFAEQDRRRYGGTALAFGRFAGLEGALTED
jgi:16S rRNA (guanine966-N2)-methyltransferase